MRCALALVTVALALGAGALPPCRAEEQPDLRSVIEAVEREQAKVRTVDISWRQERYTSAPSAPPSGGAPGASLSKRDVRSVESVRFVIDGAQIRFDHSQVTRSSNWDLPPTSGVIKDGLYRLRDRPGQALVRAQPPMLSRFDYYPVVLAYRLLDPEIGLAKAKEVSLVGRRRHYGHDCVVVQTPPSDGGRVCRFYLAEDLSYMPVLFGVYLEDGSPVAQLAINYKQGPDGLWRLTSWQRQSYASGGLWLAMAGSVTELKLNEPVDPELFELEFPEGTKVFDYVDDETYTVGPGREKIPEPPPRPRLGGYSRWAGVTPPRVARRRRRIAMAVGAGVVLAGAAAVYLWRRNRR